jgi:hypothetical protein
VVAALEQLLQRLPAFVALAGRRFVLHPLALIRSSFRSAGLRPAVARGRVRFGQAVGERRFDMVISFVRRSIALAILVATAAVAALIAPAPIMSAPEQAWVPRAASTCEGAGGTLTTPGGNVIFECTFPSSINVLDILGTTALSRTLVHICFGPAGGNLYGPIVADNAVACFVQEPL